MRTNIKKHGKSNKHLPSPPDLASHEDVLIEILLRLPIRSLLRSKCVSKHWRSLISDNRFAHLRNPNPNPPLGMFLQRIGDVAIPEYDFVSFDCEQHVKPPFKTLSFHANVSNSGIIVMQSSNGLMLCYSLHEQFCNIAKAIEYNAIYYVYNPTINQVVTLPKPKLDWNGRRPRGVTLAFDPLKSVNYKVICVQGHLLSDNDFYTIEIYSSENGSWKVSGEPFSNHFDTEFMCGVYWNDAVHWVSRKGYVLYLKINEDAVLDRIPAPAMHDGWKVTRHCCPLVESRDCLLFIDIFPPCSMKFDIHEMNRDYSGWVVKYHVDISQVMHKPLLVLGFNRPLQLYVIHCLVVGEREEDVFLVLEAPGKVIRYNIVLGTYQELCDIDLSRLFRLSVADDGFSKFGRWPGAFLFFESLSHV